MRKETNPITAPAIGLIVVVGMIAGIALIASVLIGGQTFGQRCAKRFDWGSDAWKACMIKLKEGEGNGCKTM